MEDARVDIVRRAYEIFNGRDFDRLSEVCEPDVTWRWGELFFESDESGLDQLCEFFGHWVETFPDVQVKFERAIDAGDRLVVLATQHGSGSASGIALDMAFAQVLSFANGRLRDIRMYTDRAEALEDAGIPAHEVARYDRER